MTAPSEAVEPAAPAVLQPIAPVRRRRRRRWTPQVIIAYLVLVPGAILFVAPFAWLVSASFQPMGEIFSSGPHWIPQNPTTIGYRRFLAIGHLTAAELGSGTGDWKWFANSFFVAGSRTILQTFFNALAAYAFAKRKFPGRDAIFVVFLGTMMIPPQVTLIPNYLVIKHIPFFGGNDALGHGGSGWLDSYYGLILPGTVSAFGIFLLRQYMKSIPDDLLDAARIDGAGEFRIFWQVVIPLCTPVLAASAIFTFQDAWEDLLWPLIIISKPEHVTAALGLALFAVKNRTSWNFLFAGSVISCIPMVIIFAFFQRRFIQGIAVSGVKG